MGDVMIWYIVLWSLGCEGSCTRPAPAALTSAGFLVNWVLLWVEHKTWNKNIESLKVKSKARVNFRREL